MRIIPGVILLALTAAAHAQSAPPSPQNIDADASAQHLVSRTEPTYPPIAKAAHVTGDVQLRLQIDRTGHVTAVKTLSGPPMLVGAATEAVKQWLYKPFEIDGEPVTIYTTVTLNFALSQTPSDADDDSISMDYVKREQACHQAVFSHADTAQQAKACRTVADLAEQFRPSGHFITRRGAYVFAATAYLNDNQLKIALDYADKAVKVVQQGHDDGSGSNAAYYIRGQIEAALGDLRAADRDLDTAEDFERAAIEKMMPMDAEFTKHQYVPTLKGLLTFHARLLTAMGKPTEAQVKSEEASKL
jgi:TonB family protein